MCCPFLSTLGVLCSEGLCFPCYVVQVACMCAVAQSVPHALSLSGNLIQLCLQVIVISFTLIISSMLATFAFVLNVGAVRFND